MARNDWHYPRTQLAKTIMDGFEKRNQKAYLLFERRRMGKTFFLQTDLSKLARKQGWICLYVSFFELRAGAEQLLTYELERLREAHRLPSPVGALKRLEIKGLGAVEFRDRKQSGTIEVTDALLYMDRLIGKVSSTDPLLLLLDEFQDVSRQRGSEAFLKQLRTSLDKRNGRVCAVFTGSSLDGLRQIFDDKRRAFYGFATRMTFPAFDEKFVEHCRKAFRKQSQRELPEKDAIEAFERLDRVTGHFRRYVELRLLNANLDHETALNQIHDEFSADFQFLNEWLQLDVRERAVLILLCAGVIKPFSRTILDQMQALAESEDRFERGHMQAVLRKLSRKRLIDRSATDHTYYILDMDFKRWVHSRYHNTASPKPA